MTPQPNFHSIVFDADECDGCALCVGRCPTTAIEVQAGKVRIDMDSCIDCGECIRACHYGAIQAVADPLSMTRDFLLKVAVPAPALYGQFNEPRGFDHIREGLLELGFDQVYDVYEAAELVASATKELLMGAGGAFGWNPSLPIISSSCPAVVKLVQIRFPSLIPYLAPLLPPMEVAARRLKEGLRHSADEVGVFFISPCAGKVTGTRSPQGYSRSVIDGVIGLKDIYLPLCAAMDKTVERQSSSACGPELGPSDAAGGAAIPILEGKSSIAVDGIANVIDVLNALEHGKIKNIAYIEALACPAGCVGGPLATENPFVAKARLGNRALPLTPAATARRDVPLVDLLWESPVLASRSCAFDP